MIRLGVDPHKKKHVIVACDLVGKELGKTSVNANIEGYRQALEWSNKFSGDKIWGIENPQSYARGFAQFLVNKEEKVLAVPSQLTGVYRKKSTKRDKSDYHDALGVARALLQEEDKLKPVLKEGKADDLRLILEHYDNLISEQTQKINRLHAILKEIDADYLSQGELTKGKVITYWLNQAKEFPGPYQTVLKSLCMRILQLIDEIKDLEKQYIYLVEEFDPKPLLDIKGVGKLMAAKLIALTGNPTLFKNAAAFAKYCGAAPISLSSGSREIYVVNPGGNRKLNAVLHRIMLTQLRCYEESKLYYQKKLSEGKTKREAQRCLKRQIANRVFNALTLVNFAI
jgi:transposase